MADLNILVDQTMTNDFKPFGSAMTKIQKRQVDKSYEIYLCLYQAVTGNEVDILDPKLGESILDPACGTGGFLTCEIEHLRKQVSNADDENLLQATIHGVEKKPLPHMLAMTNMMLHGIDVPTNIRHDNTLSRPLRSKPLTIQEFDHEKAWLCDLAGSEALRDRSVNEYSWQV